MRCISDRREQSAATKQLCYSGMSAIISNPQHHQPHHLHEGSTTRAHLAGPGNRKHRHACDSTCHTIASIRAHPPPTIHTTTPILHRHPPAITSSSSASQQRSPAAVAFLCSGGVVVRGVFIGTQLWVTRSSLAHGKVWCCHDWGGKVWHVMLRFVF